MKKRPFGTTGFCTSEIGLGCWQLGGDCWGDMDEDSAFEILRTGASSRGNFLDTADVYGSGRSEELIGKFLKETSGEFFVATKLGRQAHVFPDNCTKENLLRCTEESLGRLGLEQLDLTQLHCLPANVLQKGEAFDAMREQQAAGLIRNWGASVESVEEALLCLEEEGLASLQIIFNLFRQKPAESLLEKAKEKNVAIIVRLPLASGLLSGKLSVDSVFSENDHRSFNENGELFNVGETFAGLGLEKGAELAEELSMFVPENFNMAEFALRWILDFDEVTTIIPGASRSEQAKANFAVSNLPSLSDELHERIKAFYEEKVEANVRGPY
mgnify:CR=1 FL=1